MYIFLKILMYAYKWYIGNFYKCIKFIFILNNACNLVEIIQPQQFIFGLKNLKVRSFEECTTFLFSMYLYNKNVLEYAQISRSGPKFMLHYIEGLSIWYEIYNAVCVKACK